MRALSQKKEIYSYPTVYSKFYLAVFRPGDIFNMSNVVFPCKKF